VKIPESFSPGIYGYLFLLVGVIAGFAFLSAAFQIAWLAALLAYAMVFQREALSRMARWPLLVFAVVLLIVSSVNVEPNAEGHAVVSWNPRGILLGLRMLLRAMGIFIAAQIFAVRVPVLDLARLADAIGLRGFGFSLGVAFHMLPEVHVIARETGDALRLRGILRTHRLSAARQWIIAILVQLIQRSDEIVASARTRGFGSGRRYSSLNGALVTL
jgi:energy-coupling factor transporter transmembrane protein EcfT